MLGMGTAWASVTGAGALLLAQLPSIVISLSKIQVAASGMLGPLGAAAALIAYITTVSVGLAKAEEYAAEQMQLIQEEAAKQGKSYREVRQELKDFVEENPMLDPTCINEIRFIFDKTGEGVVIIDNIGFWDPIEN